MEADNLERGAMDNREIIRRLRETLPIFWKEQNMGKSSGEAWDSMRRAIGELIADLEAEGEKWRLEHAAEIDEVMESAFQAEAGEGE